MLGGNGEWGGMGENGKQPDLRDIPLPPRQINHAGHAVPHSFPFDCSVLIGILGRLEGQTVGGTSMIGNGQGEAEIPLDLAEGVLPTGKA
jgi:hypothetical protein